MQTGRNKKVIVNFSNVCTVRDMWRYVESFDLGCFNTKFPN
jgi:hypothetical protein